MAIKIPHNKEISAEGKNVGEEESVLTSVEEERIGGAQTLRKESEEGLISEILIPKQS